MRISPHRCYAGARSPAWSHSWPRRVHVGGSSVVTLCSKPISLRVMHAGMQSQTKEAHSTQFCNAVQEQHRQA